MQTHATETAALSERDDGTLAAEARLFTHHLLGVEPEAAIVARYVAAHRERLDAPPTDFDRSVLGFCRRYPRTLPFLDAACGVFAPDSLLRRKLLIMTAVLEATTRHAPAFLPARTPIPWLLVRLAGLGLAAAFKLVIGSTVLLVARSRG